MISDSEAQSQFNSFGRKSQRKSYREAGQYFSKDFKMKTPDGNIMDRKDFVKAYEKELPYVDKSSFRFFDVGDQKWTNYKSYDGENERSTTLISEKISNKIKYISGETEVKKLDKSKMFQASSESARTSIFKGKTADELSYNERKSGLLKLAEGFSNLKINRDSKSSARGAPSLFDDPNSSYHYDQEPSTSGGSGSGLWGSSSSNRDHRMG